MPASTSDISATLNQPHVQLPLSVNTNPPRALRNPTVREKTCKRGTAQRQFITNSFYFERNVIDDRLCGLVVRVPAYRTEMSCVSCEVRTEFIYVM
jgi:hypothetical protein